MRKSLRPPFRVVWEITKASFAVLTGAPKLLGFSLLGFLLMLMAAAPFLILAANYVFNHFPWKKLNESLAHSNQGMGKLFSSEFHAISWPNFLLTLVLFALWILGGAFIQIFSQIAIISAIVSYFRGEKVSFVDAFNEAWSLRKAIWNWAVLSTAVSWLFALVSMGVRLLDRIPWLGRFIIEAIGDVTHVAWKMATFFVVPILIQERLSVTEACKQSVALLKARWREMAIINVVGLGDLFGLLILPLLLVWTLLLFWLLGRFGSSHAFSVSGSHDYFLNRFIGGSVIVFIVLRSLLSLLNTVLATILRTTLYIHATEGIVPAPFTPELMDKAWVVKKSSASLGDNFFMRQQESVASGSGTIGASSLFRRYGYSSVLRLLVILVIALTVVSYAFPRGTGYVNSRLNDHLEISKLYVAAQDGDLNKVKEMVNAKPALASSKYFDTGGTALHVAAMTGHKDVAAFLLANGADVNAKDDDGETPLHYAASRNHKDVAELLLANKAKLDVYDAAALGDLEEVKAMIAANPGLVFSPDSLGMTPLHWAATTGQKDVVEMLLADKADVDAKGKKGDTPLMAAAGHGHKDVVELLLAHGANVNARNNHGNPALYGAVWMNNVDIVEVLLAHGADVNVRNNDGQTPLDLALKGQRGAVATLLRQHGGVQ